MKVDPHDVAILIERGFNVPQIAMYLRARPRWIYQIIVNHHFPLPKARSGLTEKAIRTRLRMTDQEWFERIRDAMRQNPS